MIVPLSSTLIKDAWQEQQNRRTIPLIDWEMGAEFLNEPSGDRFTTLWEAYSDGSEIRIRTAARADSDFLVLTDTGITQIALAFDQSMRPQVAYMAAGVCKFYHWDSLTNAYITDTYAGAITPRLCTDEKRGPMVGTEDVILCYLKGFDLCARYQRERYLTEHVIVTDENAIGLTTIGMNDANRLQWKLRPKPGWRPT